MPVIGKAGDAGPGRDADRHLLGLQRALPARDTLKGNPPVDVVVPKTGVVAGVYVQGISAFAPHPNAAKLWMEYLYSDEGQLSGSRAIATRSASTTWPGAARPAGAARQAAAGRRPMPRPVFPTLDQQDAAKAP